MSQQNFQKTPLVSVLLSCFNAGRWLSETVESVLSQSFADFEFIIIDDGSGDNTRDIISRHAEEDARIVPIFKKNTGLPDSLNTGLRQAKGTWVARIDADDLCEPTRLEEQVEVVRRMPDVVLVGANYREIDEEGRELRVSTYPEDHATLLMHLERLMRFFPHSSAFYRADLARSVGGYNPRIRKAEDWRLWLALAMLGRVHCIQKPLVSIRTHADQISFTDRGVRQQMDAVAATVCHFLQRAGVKDPSSAENEEEWQSFLGWVEGEPGMSQYLARRDAWVSAKNRFSSTELRLLGLARFGGELLRSGHAVPLVFEKLRGCSLPEELAACWMKGKRA